MTKKKQPKPKAPPASAPKESSPKTPREGLTGRDMEVFEDGLFITLAVAGIVQILQWSSGEVMTWIVGLVSVLSLIAGYSGGRTGRPYIGMIMIGTAIVVYSFQFTGAVGMSMFGPYWASVQQTGEAIIEPISDAMGGVSQTFGDLGLLMSCPNCYFAEMQRRQETAMGKIKSGGTRRSVEMTNFEAMNYGSAEPIIDPRLPIIGRIDIENKGEFDANNVKVILKPLRITDPAEVSINEPGKGHYSLSVDNCNFTTCSGPDPQGDTCEWTETFKPDDIRELTFKCGDPLNGYKDWSSGASGYHMDNCKCHYCNDIGEDGNCDSWDDAENYPCSNITECKVCTNIDDEWLDFNCQDYRSNTVFYTWGGLMIDIPLEYTFRYNVSSSIEVNIMQPEYFKEVRDQPEPSGYASEFSGGPAKLNLWTQKQPLRSEEESYARFSILNTGPGLIESGTTVKVMFPKVSGLEFSGNPEIISLIGFVDPCDYYWNADTPYFECTLKGFKDPDTGKHGLSTSEAATGLFWFKYDMDSTVDQKKIIFTGEFSDYKYTDTKEISMQILGAPRQ